MRVQRTAVILLPLLKRRGSGVMSWIFTPPLSRASPKTGPYVVSVRSVKVSPGVANEQGTCGPTSATKHLVSIEPRPRILLVGIDDKTRIRFEGVGCPLPDITNHLAAAKSAVARRESSHFNQA